MSRGVKDLRELICVSRLTARSSDDESSDNSDISLECLEYDTSFKYLHSNNPANFDEEYLATSSRGSNSDPSPIDGRNSSDSDIKCLSSINGNINKSVKGRPNSKPLPPIASDKPRQKPKNFDDILKFLDPDLITEFLETSCCKIAKLKNWCFQQNNFIKFSHFWLSEMPGLERHNIISMEYSIFIDYLKLAFCIQQNSSDISFGNVMNFANGVLHEYPKKLFSSRSSYLFLDYLDVMISERDADYKQLLSYTHCSTSNKQFAQFILILRAFALINIWSAIVNFYQSLHPSKTDNSVNFSTDCHNHWNFVIQSIREGYTDVIQYLISSKKVLPNQIDENGRSLIFIAVTMNKPEILSYLIKQIRPPININAAAYNGNTPLHAASNSGEVLLVTTLLKAPHLKIDAINTECDNATPLHLAAMHGHMYVVEVLVTAGANTNLKMGNLTAYELAVEFEHDDIADFLNT